MPSMLHIHLLPGQTGDAWKQSESNAALVLRERRIKRKAQHQDRPIDRHLWFDLTQKIALLFWTITQLAVIILYWRFGTSYRSYLLRSRTQEAFLNFWPHEMGPIRCPETSVRNYHYSLRNNSEERSSRILRGGSLKSLWRGSVFKGSLRHH